jgi:predicted metal-dependent TIM-barrel fold hydrolase
MEFIKYAIIWVGSNLAVPFWVVGHVHLTTNVYEDIYEIIASCGMNILVMVAFWLEWRKHKKENN